jgi:hypothetical protein
MQRLNILLILIAIALAPLGIGRWVYRIGLDTQEFHSAYLEFIMELSAAGISFWLFTVFWTSQQKAAQRERARRIVVRFLQHIQDLAIECEEWLAKTYTETQVQESEARDAKVLQLLRSMKAAQEGLLLYYPQEEIKEDESLTTVTLELFMDRIVPAISELGTRSLVRGETASILTQLGEIKVHTQEGLEQLTVRRVWRLRKQKRRRRKSVQWG